MSGFVGLFIKYTKNMCYMHPVNTKGTERTEITASPLKLDYITIVCMVSLMSVTRTATQVTFWNS